MQAEPGGALSGHFRPGGPSRHGSCRGRRASRSERDNSTGRSLACKVGEALAGRLLVLHEHGGKRLPRRGLEGCLVALVDVDELYKCPEHAGDRGQPARTRPGPRFIKCLEEGLSPRRPLVTFSIRRPALVFRRRQCSLR